MTTSEARNYIIQSLIPRYGEGEATSIARIILEDRFGVKADWQANKVIDRLDLEPILIRLVAGEPVQYVLGAADFFGLKFKVTPAVLIPRQETEELVAQVLLHLKSTALASPDVLDIGLGSGCIGLTLKKKFPKLQLFGLEKSAEALGVANENKQFILGDHTADVDFRLGDILQIESWDSWPTFDVIVSNPPYIPTDEKHLVPQHVQWHEPWLALFVEDSDRLVFYRVIADFSIQKLRSGGSLFFECNEFNAGEVAIMLHEKGFFNVQLQKDLSGADRILVASR